MNFKEYLNKDENLDEATQMSMQNLNKIAKGIEKNIDKLSDADDRVWDTKKMSKDLEACKKALSKYMMKFEKGEYDL